VDNQLDNQCLPLLECMHEGLRRGIRQEHNGPSPFVPFHWGSTFSSFPNSAETTSSSFFSRLTLNGLQTHPVQPPQHTTTHSAHPKVAKNHENTTKISPTHTKPPTWLRSSTLSRSWYMRDDGWWMVVMMLRPLHAKSRSSWSRFLAVVASRPLRGGVGWGGVGWWLGLGLGLGWGILNTPPKQSRR
jgi:hypothetical protein